MLEDFPVRETIVWRHRIVDKQSHTASTSISKGVRCLHSNLITGLDACLCQTCNTWFVDEAYQLPDVRSVFNVQDAPPGAVYIGRGRSLNHWGNPFSHLARSRASVMVDSLAETIASFEGWLLGKIYSQVEPDRRRWILSNLHTLKGKPLSCHCAPPEGVNLSFQDCCHGQAYLRLLEDEKRLIQLVAELNDPIASSQPRESAVASRSSAPTLLLENPAIVTRVAQELKPGAWFVPDFLEKGEQEELLFHVGNWMQGTISDWMRSAGCNPARFELCGDQFPVRLSFLAYRIIQERYPKHAETFRPDTCILSWFSLSSSLGIAQSKTAEAGLLRSGSPIVNLFLGNPCRGVQGESKKTGIAHSFEIKSGDLWTIGGKSRSSYHGIPGVRPGRDRLGLPPGTLQLSIQQRQKREF